VSGCASVPVIPSELHERVDRRVSFEQVKESPASYQGRLIVVGEAGNGMGPESRDLIVPPANFHLGKYRSKTDIELLIAIEDGVLFSPMHAWRHKLTKEQTRDIIDYIRFFAPVSTDS